LSVDIFLFIYFFRGCCCCCLICRIAEDMNMGSKGDPHEVGVVAPELDEEDVKSFDKVQKIIEG
jgi:hypothetical protein